MDIIQLLENPLLYLNLTQCKRFELLFTFNKVRKEFRNEKILMLFMLNFLYLDIQLSLENISFI